MNTHYFPIWRLNRPEYYQHHGHDAEEEIGTYACNGHKGGPQKDQAFEEHIKDFMRRI